MLLHKGSSIDAVDLLERIVQTVPSSQMRPRFNLAIGYSQLGLWNESLEQVIHILRRKTENGGTIDTAKDEAWKLYQTILDLSNNEEDVVLSFPEILDEKSLAEILKRQQ